MLRLSLIMAVVLPLLACCGSGGTNNKPAGKHGEEIPLQYAENLTLLNSRNMSRPTYATRGTPQRLYTPTSSCPIRCSSPTISPQGTVVRTPLKKCLVYSSVHNSLISELGAIEAIKGVCDAQYIHQPDLARRIADATVEDCGNSMAPNIEKIIKINPDGILLSPFENSGSYGKLGQLGIPIIECADYMETSPLGRAEWMKFYGLLYGREREASDMFSRTESEYKELCSLTDSVSFRPRVLVDRLYGQAWNVPAAESTMGIFIENAGGKNPFDNNKGSGSVGLNAEKVLHQAGDADIWIVRYSQTSDKTLSELATDNPVYSQVKALKNGNVYGCNTSKVFFYEEVPFHPHWLLADLIAIFHPEIESGRDASHNYFTLMQP